jgi:predicted GNAT family N-acyltransferase
LLRNHTFDEGIADIPSFVIRRFYQAESPSDFELARTLRVEVFVQEQAVPLEEEQDEDDDKAVHWLLLHPETQEALATGRLVAYQVVCYARPVAKIGRVAVKRTQRGQRLGEKLMGEILATVEEQGYDQVILDAQTRALPFYAKLGFIPEGDPFFDAGIEHYRMRRILR